MFLFAHNGVEHSTKAETAVHNLPAMLGVTFVAVGLILLAAYLLSRPARKPKKEK